jgi:hypothetical protein
VSLDIARGDEKASERSEHAVQTHRNPSHPNRYNPTLPRFADLCRPSLGVDFFHASTAVAYLMDALWQKDVAILIGANRSRAAQ